MLTFRFVLRPDQDHQFEIIPIMLVKHVGKMCCSLFNSSSDVEFRDEESSREM